MPEPTTVSEAAAVVVPPFARTCRDFATEAWGASFEHPFVAALADGSLSADRFRFYQMQDARYLEAFADTCSTISTRIEDPTTKLWFIDAARLAIVVEQQLHSGYGKTLGYSPEDIRTLDLTPNNRAYQNHMVSCAARGSLLEAIAAMTPCPWLYTELGGYLAGALGTIPDDHPYADWLRTYADPGFVTYTNELLEILEDVASRCTNNDLERARRVFAVSARYEWMFWDQAWNTQAWPI